MLAKQIQIKDEEIPSGWNAIAANFINKLLRRKPMERLGVNGPGEVRNHPWLKNFDWKALYEKKLKAPFIPPVFSVLRMK